MPFDEAGTAIMSAAYVAKSGIGYPARIHYSPFPYVPWCVGLFLGQSLMTFHWIDGGTKTAPDWKT
jgi:hypothetical protein